MTDLERLNIDAARYRWLRENLEKFDAHILAVDDEDSNGYWSIYVTADECDSAIDAELARDE